MNNEKFATQESTTNEEQVIEKPETEKTEVGKIEVGKIEVEKIKNAEGVLAKNRELLGEIKKLKDKQEADERRRLEEQEKFKELYELEVKKVSDLEKLNEVVSDYENYFQVQLDEEMLTADDTIKQLIEESNFSLSKKLEWIKRLKGQRSTSSPASSRPGNTPDASLNINLKDYIGAEGRAKLMELRKTNKPLYEKIIELKQRR